MIASRRLQPASIGIDLTTNAAVKGVAFFVLWCSGIVDLPVALHIGPVSSQAILTICYFFAALFLLPLIAIVGRPHPVKTLPLLIFVVWAATSLVWTTALSNGLQNVLVISTFLILIWFGEAAVSSELGLGFWVEKQLGRSALLAVMLYTLALLCFGPGTNDLFGARSFGLFALFGVAWQLARWRYCKRSGLFCAALITLVIGASQSRLALGIAIILFPLAQMPSKKNARPLKMFSVFLSVLVLSWAGFNYSDSLQQRFFSGDLSLKIGSVGINVSGRTAFWRVTVESLSEAPFVGKGAGSTEGLVESVFVDIRHPHSDYLRIAHDYGLAGCAIWVTALLSLIFALWREWRYADIESAGRGQLQLTALLGLIAFALEMTMENALVYVFVTAPLGLLVGSAFGSRRASVASDSCLSYEQFLGQHDAV